MVDNEDVIQELTKTLRSIREKSVETQAQLLVEARTNNKLYVDILHELRRMNMFLEDKKSILIK